MKMKMSDLEIIESTKAGSLKRQYLLTKNLIKRGTLTNIDFYFIKDTFEKLVNNLDELILFEIKDK